MIIQIGACKEEDCLEVCHTVVYINYYVGRGSLTVGGVIKNYKKILNFTGSILFLHLSDESVVFLDDVVDVVDVARSLTVHQVIMGWCLKVDLNIVLSRDGHCSDDDFGSARDGCSAYWASLESGPHDTVLTEHMTTVQGELGAGVVGAQPADD